MTGTDTTAAKAVAEVLGAERLAAELRRQIELGLPIATAKKTTDLALGPGSTTFCLLETRLRCGGCAGAFHAMACAVGCP
jgi:hypothetical protein